MVSNKKWEPLKDAKPSIWSMQETKCQVKGKFKLDEYYILEFMAATRPKNLAAPQGSGLGLRPNSSHRGSKTFNKFLKILINF